MKFTPIFLLLFFIITLNLIHAQTNSNPIFIEKVGSITGKIIDKTTKEPMPYVNVVLKESNKIVTGGITSDKGIFVIKNIALKNYTVEIQFIGYKTILKSISLSKENSSIDLKTIAIEENAIELQGVEIIREKSTIEQKIDRKIINVGKDLVSAGATAGEIMNNIPSVSVDPQTNEISLRGNENVRILIDGKPTNIEASQLLKQIPSSSIKQIELITNPSAKYNPEGMSGMINIVLNKNTKIGFNGTVSNGVTIGITPKMNSSFDLNYRRGKFNFFTNYGFSHGLFFNRGQINNNDTGRENIQRVKIKNKNTSHLLKLGFDYYLNDYNTLSFYTNQNFFNENTNSNVTVDFQNDFDRLQRYNNKSDNSAHTYNFDYKHKFKKEGHNIELEVNYNDNKEPENSVFTFINLDANTIDNIDTNDINNYGKNTIVNLDYTNPLTETIKLELGLENRQENTSNVFLLDGNSNSDFRYKRDINSAYANIGKQLKKWSFQTGVRLEQYKVDALFREVSKTDIPFKNNLFNIYPSSFISYNSSDKNTFNLSFSRRVDRPSISRVNPIREWSTPTVESRGNPLLVPQFTNSFELNFTRKTKIGSITSGIFYRRIEDEITRVVFTNPDDANRRILSYTNFNNNDAYGVEVSSNLDFTKWWSSNISVDTYKKKVKGTVETTRDNLEFISVDVTNFNTRMINNFKINKDLRFQVSGMFRGRDISLQYVRNVMWKIDLGSSYTILKGKGTVSARVSDIFNTMIFSFAADKPFKANGRFRGENQTGYLGFNYRFGGKQTKSLQRKQRENNENQGGGML